MSYIRTLITIFALCFVGASICSAQIISKPETEVPMTAKQTRVDLFAAGTTEFVELIADPGSRSGDMFHVISPNARAVVSLMLPD